jgi:hypothetical protein
MSMEPVVRFSSIRCAPDKFAGLRQMMMDADPVLRPGIETNTTLWQLGPKAAK